MEITTDGRENRALLLENFELAREHVMRVEEQIAREKQSIGKLRGRPAVAQAKESLAALERMQTALNGNRERLRRELAEALSRA